MALFHGFWVAFHFFWFICGLFLEEGAIDIHRPKTFFGPLVAYEPLFHAFGDEGL